jgi:hypothetical protein
VPTQQTKDFWEFHRQALATLGQTLPAAAIGWRFAKYLLHKILNPGQTVTSLLEPLHRSPPPTRGRE